MFDRIQSGDGLVVAMPPQDLATTAKSTNRASVRHINKFLFLAVTIGAGTATHEITVSLKQSKDASGTGEKALNVKEVYFKAGAAGAILAATDKFKKSSKASREAPVANYETADDRVAATNQFLAVFRISPADLDQANGFEFVSASFNVATGAQLATAHWLPEGLAYHGSDRTILAN